MRNTTESHVCIWGYVSWDEKWIMVSVLIQGDVWNIMSLFE